MMKIATITVKYEESDPNGVCEIVFDDIGKAMRHIQSIQENKIENVVEKDEEKIECPKEKKGCGMSKSKNCFQAVDQKGNIIEGLYRKTCRECLDKENERKI